MRQIARLAGISLSTVFHALHDHAEVSPQTRERIKEIARKLNYALPEARVPTFGGGRVIGYLIHEWFSDIATDILRGAAEEASKYKISILLYQIGPDRQWIEEAINNLLEVGISGLMLAHSFQKPMPRRVLLAIRSHGIHVVQVMTRLFPEPVDSVCRDERMYARLAVEHLAALGHRQVIGMKLAAPAVWEEEFRARGMTITLTNVNGAVEVRNAFQALLRMSPRPTAAITAMDITAHVLQSIAREHGLRVPDDLSIIGMGNIYRDYFYPDITTIDIQSREMGRTGIKLLADRITAGTPPHAITDFKDIVLPARIIPRASTGPAPQSTAPIR